MKDFNLAVPKPQLWDPESSAVVFRLRQRFGSLSNMSMCKHILFDGEVWTSSEALYQAQRFPHLPDHQEAIRRALTGFAAKTKAYERIGETRHDWQSVKHAAMAFVLTERRQCRIFCETIEDTGCLPIIEKSFVDGHWGAIPTPSNQHGNAMFGVNMLGILQMQLRNGARMSQAYWQEISQESLLKSRQGNRLETGERLPELACLSAQ